MGVANGTDGCLDESGFIGRPEADGPDHPSVVKLGHQWENTVRTFSCSSPSQILRAASHSCAQLCVNIVALA